MLLNCGVGEDSWESLGLQEDPIRSKQSELSACFNSLGAGGKGRWNVKHTLACSVCEHLESKAAGIWPQNGRFKTSHAKIIT